MHTYAYKLLPLFWFSRIVYVRCAHPVIGECFLGGQVSLSTTIQFLGQADGMTPDYDVSQLKHLSKP